MVLMSALLAGTGLAAPKATGTPGEICSKAGGRKEKDRCCEEAFDECLRGCPRGAAGPEPSCAEFCDRTVRQACLRDVAGKPGSPKPQPPAGAIEEPRPGVPRPGGIRPRSETPETSAR